MKVLQVGDRVKVVSDIDGHMYLNEVGVVNYIRGFKTDYPVEVDFCLAREPIPFAYSELEIIQ